MLMEPWDGPAALVFTDGTLVGATLDRNGLRPGRFLVTDDGLVVLASEIGVLDFPPDRIVRKGRLRPGKMFLVDTAEGRIVEDDEIKAELAASQPWQDWLDEGRIHLADLPEREHITHTPASVVRRQRTFGYTEEEVRILVGPMAQHGVEPLGAMGSDTPIAVLSDRPRLLFDYFTQQFAQVTNPPLDSIREEVVTSMSLGLGPERNLLTATPEHARQIVLDFPVIDNDELAKIQHFETQERPQAGPRHPGSLQDQEGREGAREAARRDVRGGGCRDRGRLAVPGAERPGLERRSRADPVAADARRRASPPHPAGDPHEVRDHRRGRRRARGAPGRPAGRIRRVRDQPVPRDGDGRAARAERHAHRHHAREGGQEPHQGARQGRAEDHVQDGHLGRRLVRGRAGVRGDRPQPGVRRPVLHRHDQPARRRRPRHDRGRERRAPRGRVPAGRRDARARAAAGRRRVPVAPRGTAAPVQPRHRVPAAARDPRAPVRHLPRLHPAGRRAGREPDDPARAVQAEGRRPAARPDRRGRADRVDHPAVQHRRDELRLDQPGGARDPRDRDEPHRRALEHRGGRRRRRPPHRSRAPQPHQAGRERPIRRDEHVPHERHRHPDQDGAGRQARRGRPAAGRQGLPVDRPHPARHRRRRPDLAAAAPRHLLDRRPQAADLRPEARQPRGARPRQARQPVRASARSPPA